MGTAARWEHEAGMAGEDGEEDTGVEHSPVRPEEEVCGHDCLWGAQDGYDRRERRKSHKQRE